MKLHVEKRVGSCAPEPAGGIHENDRNAIACVPTATAFNDDAITLTRFPSRGERRSTSFQSVADRVDAGKLNTIF
jgi:hypothetical protein